MLDALPPQVARVILGGIADGIDTVFMWSVPLAIVVALLAWFVKEVPLRGHDDEVGQTPEAGMAATPEEEAETAAAIAKP